MFYQEISLNYVGKKKALNFEQESNRLIFECFILAYVWKWMGGRHLDNSRVLVWVDSGAIA